MVVKQRHVPFNIPLEVKAPVVQIAWLKVQLSVELFQRIVLSDAPFKVIPPPSAVVSEGEATEPSSIFLSSTETVVEFIVVVVPLTVKSPEMVREESVPTEVICVWAASTLSVVPDFDNPVPAVSIYCATKELFWGVDKGNNLTSMKVLKMFEHLG